MESPLTAINRLHPLQGLALTFKQDGISSLARLYGMTQSDNLEIECQDVGVVLAVMSYNAWGSTTNRTVHVRRAGFVKDTITFSHILRDVEKVAVSGEHGAMALQSSREVKRGEALEAISRDVFTPCFLASIEEEYGAIIKVSLAQPTKDKAWMAYFEIMDGDETIGNIYLDSFTGRWARVSKVGWEWSNDLYINPRQLQGAIVTALEAYLA